MNDLELEERLRTDAARWNAMPRTGPDLAEAVQRLASDTGRRSRSWFRPSLAVAATVLVVSGIAVAVEMIGHSQTNTTSAGDPATCGHAPTSFGRYASQVVATLSAPRSAAAGSVIHPRLSVRAAGEQTVRLDVGQPAPVYITRHGEIVGRYNGLIGGTGLGLILTGKPTPIPAESLLLSGCPASPLDFAHPDAGREPLPPGDYQIVATLGGGRSHHEWQIASTPSNITITPDPALERLAARARSAATAEGDPNATAEAVRTTLADAARVALGGVTINNPPGTTPVWVIQVHGTFTCTGCRSVRPGGSPPTGHAIVIILNADTFDDYGGGLMREPKDLSTLGAVIQLPM